MVASPHLASGHQTGRTNGWQRPVFPTWVDTLNMYVNYNYVCNFLPVSANRQLHLSFSSDALFFFLPYWLLNNEKVGVLVLSVIQQKINSAYLACLKAFGDFRHIAVELFESAPSCLFPYSCNDWSAHKYTQNLQCSRDLSPPNKIRYECYDIPILWKRRRWKHVCIRSKQNFSLQIFEVRKHPLDSCACKIKAVSQGCLWLLKYIRMRKWLWKGAPEGLVRTVRSENWEVGWIPFLQLDLVSLLEEIYPCNQD